MCQLFLGLFFFLNPELTLKEVSLQLKIPKYKITEMIKYKGYKFFYAFVNERCTTFSKELLKNLPGHYSLDAVAIDSGFKS